jgi:hypothetical protein
MQTLEQAKNKELSTKEKILKILLEDGCFDFTIESSFTDPDFVTIEHFTINAKKLLPSRINTREYESTRTT